MMKFLNKYRIGSHRCPNWDYALMVVILLILVTQQRVCNLGSVKNDRVIISDFGIIVDNKWNLSSFVGGFKSAINSKIDDYIDEQGLKFQNTIEITIFFNLITTTIQSVTMWNICG